DEDRHGSAPVVEFCEGWRLSMFRWHLSVVVAAAAIAASSCGSSGSSPSPSAATHGGGSVAFTGDISGTWSKAGDTSESTCGADKATVHIMGAAEGDEGDLTVKSDGSVFL